LFFCNRRCFLQRKTPFFFFRFSPSFFFYPSPLMVRVAKEDEKRFCVLFMKEGQITFLKEK